MDFDRHLTSGTTFSIFILIDIGFVQSSSDRCLYLRSDGSMAWIYVDDIIVAGPNDTTLDQIQQGLGEAVSITTSEESSIIGINIERSKIGIFMNQPGYIDNILERFGFDGCHPRQIPMNPKCKPKKCSEGDPIFHDQKKYASAIGCLLYLANTTRPDILHSTTVMCQFVAFPSMEHWNSVAEIIRYLSGTKTFGLFFPSHESRELLPTFIGYTDSDHAQCTDTKISKSGIVGMIESSVAASISRKQGGVSYSTLQSESYALAEGAR